MDYRKLDAELAGEIENASPAAKLNVFIHAAEPVTEAQAAELAALGVASSAQPSNILTAAVSPDTVGRLSEVPWVTRIALGRKLRPLEGT